MNIPADDLTARWEPYQALDAAMVVRRAYHLLRPPATVTLALSENTLTASGTASFDWIAATRERVPFLSGIDAYDDQALRSEVIDQLRAGVEGQHLRFEAGSILMLPGQQQIVSALADSVQSLFAKADLMQRPVRLRILGYSSQEGSAAFNQRISEQRATLIRQQLIAAGLPATRLEALGTGGPWEAANDDEASRSQNRSVHFEVVHLSDQ